MERGRRKGRKGKDATKRRNQDKVVHNGGVDRVSELPNDILISIIGRLSFREATATSVLSSHWRHLHTHATCTHLHFPAFKQVRTDDVESEKRRFRKHIDLINRLMDSHSHTGGRGGVKELKLHLPLGLLAEAEGGSIMIMKKWVEFALNRGEIESVDFITPYDWKLGLSEVVGEALGLGASRWLKRLRLEGVGVSDQDMEVVASGFVALESLCIRGSRELNKVSIVGHPRLKHLDISHAANLRSLEIRDVANLSSLRCCFLAPECTPQLQNLPALAQFYASDCRGYHHLFARMPSCMRHQLQLLHLSTRLSRMHSFIEHPPFQFINLKHLEVEVNPMMSYSHCTQLWPLLKACQSIQKFNIKFVWSCSEVKSINFGKRGKIHYGEKLLSSNLKVVEMEGYAGCETEFSFASYIISGAENLEQLIVTVVDCGDTDTIRKNSLARAREDFQRLRPPTLDLQII